MVVPTRVVLYPLWWPHANSPTKYGKYQQVDEQDTADGFEGGKKTRHYHLPERVDKRKRVRAGRGESRVRKWGGGGGGGGGGGETISQ